MAYNVKYRADYDTLGGDNCRVEILQKDYSGAIYPLTLAADPVIQKYNTDNPTETIKGCSLTVTLINEGSLPITSFYAAEDDGFQVIHYKNGAVTFAGFLVQDDCEEEMADYRHLITLSANDNLGLLKDVALNAQSFTTFTVYESAIIETISSHTIKVSNIKYAPTTGTFEIIGTAFAGTYTATNVSVLSGTYTITVSETVGINGAVGGFYAVKQTIDFYKRNNLLSVIQACLKNTGLELFTEVYCNVFEENFKTDVCPLQQTYINTQTFLTDTTFKSCWDCLTYILNRFKLSIFQSNGKWIIVRWKELKYGDIYGFQFDKDFNFIQNVSFSDQIDVGFEQSVYPETTPLKSIVRPYRFDKETFNYQQPKYLLKNYDLQELGMPLNSYTTGSGDNLKSIVEYVAIGFTAWFTPGPSPLVFIRVISDNEGNEIERYLVIKGATGDQTKAAVGVPFEVGEGDKIELAFTFKTNISEAGPINLTFALMLTDGTNTDYADEDKNVNWKNTLGWVYQITSGGNTNQTQTVTINPGRIPYDGLIYCYFRQVCPTPNASTDETQIKDIRVTYNPYINESTKIIGHYHNTEQNLNIKNNNDEEIFVDDSPRSSIRGTFYQSAYNGLLQVRTKKWYRSTYPDELKRLGEITTLEELFQRRSPRAKIEGTFHGLTGVDMFTKVIYHPFTDIQFVFGSLEINYKNNLFNATMYEMANESDDLLTSDYTFNYLYSTK